MNGGYPCDSPTEQRWFILNVSRLNSPSLGIIVSHTDITERKRAEDATKKITDKFSSLASNISGYIAYVSAETLQYEYVNNEFEKAFGIPRDKIIGSHVKDIIGEVNYQYALEYIYKVRQGKNVAYEHSFQLASGTAWIHVNYSPIFDDSGQVSSIAVLSYDITERKLAEEQLRESEERFKRMFQDHSAIMMLVHPEEFSIVDANIAAEKFYGS